MSDEIVSRIATKNYERFQSCMSYLGSKGLTSKIPQCVDFYEGRQWANVTERTAHIPRPVINFIAKVVNNKVSNILGTPIHLNFRADNDEGSTEKFTKFASYQMKEMQQDWYDYLACLDGETKGTYVYYYYWDEKAIGKRNIMEGAVRCEVIDPLNVAVENPMEVDCQKQKWIIVKTREDVEYVKSICEKPSNKKFITPDDQASYYAKDIERDKSNLVTVYTRFFRVDNEVYFEKSTQYCDLHDPIPLNPNLNERKLIKKDKEKEIDDDLKEKEDYEVDSNPSKNVDSELESQSEEEIQEQQMKFHLYPFEISSLTPRDKCIYGISEVEPLIPNQQAVNFQYSMILLNAQALGWGKVLVKKDALKGQTVSNKPGQVLVDHTPLGSWGIQYMQGQQFSQGAFEVANQIIDASRNVTNSTDIITGDMISKELSGTAIAQMQAQATKPIEQMQKRFWRSKERIGKILELYYKLFYEDVDYSYEISQEEYDNRYQEMVNVAKENGFTGQLPNISRSSIGKFSGMDYQKTPFNIVVEAGKGTQYSEIMQMDFANNLVLNGNIDNISPQNLQLLIEMYPESAIPNKADLLRFIRQKEQSQIAQLQQQLQQAGQLLQQAQQELENRGVQIEKLTAYVKGLNSEYGKQISTLQNENASMKKFMMETSKNAKEEVKNTSI